MYQSSIGSKSFNEKKGWKGMQTYTVNVITQATRLDQECGYKCKCKRASSIKAIVEIDEKMYWHYFCQECLAEKLEDEPEFMAAWIATLSATLFSVEQSVAAHGIYSGAGFVDKSMTLESLKEYLKVEGKEFAAMTEVEAGVYA